MSMRQVLKTVAVSSAATACAAVFALGIGSGVAGASTLTSTDGNTTLSTIGTVNSGIPYSSGQQIDLSVAANSVMSSTALAAAGDPNASTGNFYVEECTDPGGSTTNLPTSASNCEATTLATAPNSGNGGISLAGAKAFTVYDLPDPGTLGPGTMTGTCDVSPNQCVLGIFAANPLTGGGFGYPHLFSAPFQVDQQADFGSGDESGLNPGDGTPEVPFAIGLPLAALAIVGGWSLRNRRRRRQQAAA